MTQADRVSSRRNGRSASSVAVAESLEGRQLLSANTSDITAPTNWHFYTGISAAALSSAVTATSARIVDLKVQTTSPLTFNAATVKNSGAYGSAWYWYYGQTGAQVAADVSATHGRIVSLDPYVVNGNLFFATLLVPNTGAAAKSWYYYYGQTPTSLASHVSANKGRLIDLEPYSVGGQTLYAAVMISNTGADAKNWHYYFNVTPTTISSLLSSTHNRLVDLNYDPNGGFDVIMQQTDNVGWYYYYGVSTSALLDAAAQDGARIFDLDSTVSGGQRVYSAVMVNNSTTLETTVGNILRNSSSTAVTGAYLKNVDGAVVANVNGQRLFEPASSVKIILAVTALRAVDAGKAHLTDSTTYYVDPKNPTEPHVNPDAFAHTAANAKTTTLKNAVTQLLTNSDNRMASALAARFTYAAVNATAKLAGLVNTTWTKTDGSGVPGNFATLADETLFYEKIEDGTLLSPASYALIQQVIPNQTNSPTPRLFDAVILNTAASLLNASVTSAAVLALANKFKSLAKYGYDMGSYNLNGTATQFEVVRVDAGYLELPVKGARGVIGYRKYAFGTFVDKAIVPTVPTNKDNPALDKLLGGIDAATQALVSGVISSAMSTFL